MSPKDLDFIEAKHGAAREVALALGVPPPERAALKATMLLGIPGDNTFSNYQEANRTFWRQTVLPLVQRTASALSEWLGSSTSTALTFKPDLDNIDALASERDSQWARLNAATFLTDDEKRAAAGYGPKPNDGSAKLFNPNQPRDPNGQWTSGDGSRSTDSGGGDPTLSDPGSTGDATNDPLQTPSIGDTSEKPQPIAGRGGLPISILEEDAAGGHTNAEHINRTDEALKQKITESRPSANS